MIDPINILPNYFKLHDRFFCTMAQPQSIDLNTLNLDQLNTLKQQLEEVFEY